MDFTKFQEARLIPVTGVKGDQDQERRAASALLAVLVGVPEFARVLLKEAGAPAGKIQTFIEPEFELDGKRIRPDGLISVERAGKKWVALVEFKTGKSTLDANQINSYLEIARVAKFDSLITISNEVLTLSGEHPTTGIDARKLRSTKLTHFSWIRIITEALIQSEHRGVKDSDQAWILRELIRFLQSEYSGANEFDDMGPNWVGVREAVVNGSLLSSDKRILDVIAKYESLMRFVAFKLSARLGVQAQELGTKQAKADPKKHLQAQTSQFVATKTLVGAIKVPGTVSDIEIVADLRAGQILCSMEIQAPQDGRSLTRVNWLLKQLPNPLTNVRVETYAKRGRSPEIAIPLTKALEDPRRLVPPQDKEVSFFKLVSVSKMGAKRGSGSGSFIESVTSAVETVYEDVLQTLRPWSQKAPKLSTSVTDFILPETADEPEVLLDESR